MRILLFGDGQWAIDSLARLKALDQDVVGVVLRTRCDTTLLAVARDLGLPVFQPDKVNDSGFVRQLRNLDLDLGLSIAYNQIIGSTVLNSAKLGFVNFHAGALPNYRGRNVVNWALINGEHEIGITAHYMDQGIDTGDIILQHNVSIAWTDTYGDAMDKVIAALPDCVEATIRQLEKGEVRRLPQSHILGSYFSGRVDGDEWLDWNDTSANLHNKVRAITRPGPGARAILKGSQVTIWKAFYDPSWPEYIATPGEVVGRRPDGVLVKTRDSLLLVMEVGMSDTSSVVPRWPIGTRLGTHMMSYLSAVNARLAVLEEMVMSTHKSESSIEAKK